MIEVTLYSRKDCHLCEITKSYLDELQPKIPHILNEIDIDEDAKLRALYGFNVPVVTVGPYKISAPINKIDLEISLAAVQHSQEEEERLTKAIQEGALQIPTRWTKSDAISYWLSKHYLAIFNVLVLIYVGLPFLAPVLMKAGLATPASVIYKGYSYVCHQFAFRSFFIFGEQVAYPRIEAHVPGLITYQQATGLDGSDLWAARAFEGNTILGYKVALCERDVAIYFGIFMFGVMFAILKRKIKPIHWIMWILIGILPIGIDGFSQLISQLPFHILAVRESTPILRSLTGYLFGFFTAWFGYPYVEESMAENMKYMQGKLAQAKRSQASQ